MVPTGVERCCWPLVGRRGQGILGNIYNVQDGPTAEHYPSSPRPPEPVAEGDKLRFKETLFLNEM